MILDVLGPPGAKSGVKCAWWAGFEPHQVRKPGKSAPGGNYQRMWILSNTSFKASYKIFAESTESTRCEIGGKVPLVGRFWAPPGAKSGVKCAWWVWVFQFSSGVFIQTATAIWRTGSFIESRGFPYLKVAATFRCNDLILFTCRYNGRRRIISIRWPFLLQSDKLNDVYPWSSLTTVLLYLLQVVLVYLYRSLDVLWVPVVT